MIAPLLPNRLLNLAPLPPHWLYCPSQLGNIALLVVDARFDMTFKVDCTRLIYQLMLPTLSCGGTCPGVLWSHQARGPCSMTVAERRYLPGYDHRCIHVVLPSERLQMLPLCHGTIALHLHATTLFATFFPATRCTGRSLVVAFHFSLPYRSSLCPRHCVVRAPVPCCCRQESLPRRRLAHRARSRALGNLFINGSCGVLRSRTWLCYSVVHVSALCEAQLEPILSCEWQWKAKGSDIAC